MRAARWWPALLCYVAALACALLLVRPNGDGGEYLLTAHALLDHGKADIRVPDAMWLAREARWRKVSTRVAGGIQLGELTPQPSIRRAPSGAYYSLHFWFYSCLATPFLWLTELVHFRPSLALAAVNGVAACAGMAALFVRYGRTATALVASVLFLLAGTTFYLTWTGPEVLTASATLIACLAARQRNVGVALLAGGVAASQNPSAVFLLPYAVGCWLPARDKLTSGARLAAFAGVCLALLPYVFFYFEYRLVSLIARFATDASLISGERAFSLVFDWNEGMIVGLPGILFGFVAVVLTVANVGTPRERRRLFTSVLATAGLVTCMAIPTFSIHNWNSGNVVFIRYAYWLVMPLFELALEFAGLLRGALRAGVAAGAGSLQLCVIAANGVGGESYHYLRHGPAAAFILRHWPAAYNPVPEIFYERSLEREMLESRVTFVAWPTDGEPTKALVREGTPLDSARLCPGGGVVEDVRQHATSGGFAYIDGPFRCRLP